MRLNDKAALAPLLAAALALTIWGGSSMAQTAATDGRPASALPHVNQLSGSEQRHGWKLLFDGKTTNGWRNFRKQDISQGWQVRDGALCRMDSTADDIVTTDQYDNFELQLDYKVPEHANSGILYRVSEDRGATWATGPEFQILDNTDPHGDPQRSGWCYALYQSPIDAKTGKPVDSTKPVGEWNHVRLVCNGPHVEHWMNGVKYCQYEIGSEDWNKRVAASKFGSMPGFGKNTKGYISLQGDHGNVCFANIKIRPLPAK
jgi:hypothetical protein